MITIDTRPADAHLSNRDVYIVTRITRAHAQTYQARGTVLWNLWDAAEHLPCKYIVTPAR